MPVVVGMSNLREVREAVAAWRWAKDEGDKRSSSAALQAGTVFLGQLGVIHSLQKLKLR